MTDLGYARRLQAPRKAKKNLAMAQRLLKSKEANKFYDAVFKTMQEYLGDKFHLPTAGLTSDVVEELRRKEIDEELLKRIRQCFDDCDSARYAPSSITKEQMAKTFDLLAGIIAEFGRMRI